MFIKHGHSNQGHRINGLSAAEEIFCIEAAKPNVTQSAAYKIAFPNSAKWKDRTVWQRASELMARPAVKAKVAEFREKSNTIGVMQIEECLLTLSHIARSDPRKCFDENGALKKPNEIDNLTAIAISEIGAKSVKMLSRIDAVDKLLRFHVQRLGVKPTEDEAATIDQEGNPYDWARRVAYLLTYGAEASTTDPSS